MPHAAANVYTIYGMLLTSSSEGSSGYMTCAVCLWGAIGAGHAPSISVCTSTVNAICTLSVRIRIPLHAFLVGTTDKLNINQYIDDASLEPKVSR